MTLWVYFLIIDITIYTVLKYRNIKKIWGGILWGILDLNMKMQT